MEKELSNYYFFHRGKNKEKRIKNLVEIHTTSRVPRRHTNKILKYKTHLSSNKTQHLGRHKERVKC